MRSGILLYTVWTLWPSTTNRFFWRELFSPPKKSQFFQSYKTKLESKPMYGRNHSKSIQGFYHDHLTKKITTTTAFSTTTTKCGRKYFKLSFDRYFFIFPSWQNFWAIFLRRERSCQLHNKGPFMISFVILVT